MLLDGIYLCLITQACLEPSVTFIPFERLLFINNKVVHFYRCYFVDLDDADDVATDLQGTAFEGQKLNSRKQLNKLT